MYYNLQAIILKRQVFKDDDLLITLYSLEQGKVILQAKGAKKILSKLAGHLEPVSLSGLNVTIGKNIDQLIGAQIIRTYSNIKSNLKLTAYANYFIELINRLTEENHSDNRIYQLLVKSLDYLESQPCNLKIARISFGFKLLHFLGFNPIGKAGLQLKSEIDFIIKNSIGSITKQENIISQLAKLNNILDKELEIHLETELKTKQFLRCLK